MIHTVNVLGLNQITTINARLTAPGLAPLNGGGYQGTFTAADDTAARQVRNQIINDAYPCPVTVHNLAGGYNI